MIQAHSSLTRPFVFQRAVFLLALIASLLTSGCAVPLGPGYTIRRQAVEVRHLESQADLSVRARYEMENSGNADLTFLEVEVPNVQAGGRRDFSAHVNGRAVAVPDDGRANRLRIPMAPPWAKKRRIDLVLEYGVALDTLARADQIGQGQRWFHLQADDWFPRLRAPEGLFARGEERHHDVRLRVTLSEGFRLVAGGQPNGRRKKGTEVEHRFRLRSNDFPPFLVAGRYQEQRYSHGETTLVFWALPGSPSELAAQAAQRLVTTASTYATTFGPVGEKRAPFFLIENPALESTDAFEAERSQYPAVSFPRIAMSDARLWNADAHLQGISLSAAERRLARTWFDHLVQARQEDALLLRDGLSEYATIVAADARAGQAARRNEAVRLLGHWEKQAVGVDEKPPAFVTPTVATGQFALAQTKSALFFVALEDRFGISSVRGAIHRMVQALRGREIRTADLRAALEAETGQDLGEFFRTWLNRPGIPEDFRKRYSSK